MKIVSRFDSTKVIFESDNDNIKDTLEDAISKNVDLAYSNLNRTILTGIDMRNVNLSYADLRHANLSQVDLKGAYLRSADLSYADLGQAYLKGANLIRTVFTCTNLNAADMRDSQLNMANLSDANLLYADLRGGILRDDSIKITIVETGRYIFHLPDLGTRNAKLTAYNTNIGIVLFNDGFLGTIPEFIEILTKKYSGTKHYNDYIKAIEMIEQYFRG